MLRANFNSPGGLFGSSSIPPSLPSRITSHAFGFGIARSSNVESGTPVHSAVPTAPRCHCTPFTFGSRKFQLFLIDRERFFHFPFHLQPPCISIDRRDRKMRPNVKRFGRRNKAVHIRERHLQVQGAFAAHDSSVAKFCFVLWHRL